MRAHGVQDPTAIEVFVRVISCVASVHLLDIHPSRLGLCRAKGVHEVTDKIGFNSLYLFIHRPARHLVQSHFVQRVAERIL